MKQIPTLATLALALLLCFSQTALLTACGGCSARHEDKSAAAQKTEAPAAEPEVRVIETIDDLERAGGYPPPEPPRVREPLPIIPSDMGVLPKQTGLTQDAEISAAYLSLMQAIADEDEAAAVAAAEILANGKDDLAMPASHWIDAALWFAERKSVNGIAFLREAWVAQPMNAQIGMLYAEALAEHNFMDDAMAINTANMARHMDDYDIVMQRGMLLFKNKKPKEAIETLETIPEASRSGFVEYYYARSLMSLGQDEAALEHVRRSLQKLPDFEDALSLLAFLSERRGDLKSAVEAYEKLLNAPYASRDVLLRLINLSLRMDQPTKALEYYRKGAADDVPYQILAASLFTEFRHYLQAERILKGIAGHKDAPAEVFLFLADLTYEQRRDLPASLQWLAKVSDDGETGQKKFFVKAQLEARAKQYDAALATLTEAEKRFKPVPELITLQTRVLSAMDRKEEALAVARKGLQDWPSSTDIAFQLGALLAETGKSEEAMAVMEGIIEKDSANYMALNYVGYTLADANKDIDRAITLLTRANALAPDQFFILDSLAWAHYRAGNLDLAWKFICEAVRLDSSNDAEIWEHYGDIAAARGQHREAREAWQKALPQSRNKEALQRKLDAGS